MAKTRKILFFAFSFFLLIFIFVFVVISTGLFSSNIWSNNLTAVQYGAIAVGDFDNNGLQDLVLAGCSSGCSNGAIAKIYTNNGITLTDNQTWGSNLIGVGWSNIALGDIDNNGKLDMVLAGCTVVSSEICTGTIITKVYTNNGNSLLENITFGQNLTALWKGSLNLADYNTDGRLDMAITGATATAYKAKVYINNGTALMDTPQWSQNITPTYDGNIVAGDINNDGKSDLIMSGESLGSNNHADVFLNNGSSFVRNNIWDANLQTATQSSIVVGDWNNDGWLDIVLNGIGDYLRFYANNKTNFIENETESSGGSACISGTFKGTLAFGDYDNDGDLDLAAAGREAGRNRIYQQGMINQWNCTFYSDNSMKLNLTTDIIYGASLWTDFDNDTNLDYLITGYSYANSALLIKLYLSNQTLISNNTSPTTPSIFDNHSIANGDIFLGWDSGNDNETVNLSLYYNLRVGTSNGGNEIVSGVFGGSSGGSAGGGGANGYFGNMMQRRNISLSGSRFQVGTTYYWSVQTIDTGLAKSAWSAEQTFTLTSDFTPPMVTLNAPSGVTNQTLNILFNASVYDDYNLTNVSLYGNWSDWHINQTNSSGINNTDYIFKANLTEGEWLWGIRACDEQSNCRGVNGTFRIDITYPIVALVSPINGTSQTSSNSVTFTYNVSDVAINNCTLYLNGVMNETDTSIAVSTSQTFAENVPNGAYNWSVKCADAANNINPTANYSLTISYTLSETPALTSGGGGGSGGGGAVSTAVTKVTRIIAAIAEGNNLIEFAESEKTSVGIEEIMLDSAAAALNVKITIEKLTAMPTSIASSPTGDVYTYLQFNKTVLKDEDVKQAKIIFTVSKDWVARNGYDYNKIVLQRYTTQWDALQTAYLKQNASNYYYQATTPGFSVFAVTVEKQQEEQPIITEKANKTEEKPVIPAEEASKAPVKAMKRLISPAYLVLIGLIIIALAVIAKLKRKRR